MTKVSKVRIVSAQVLYSNGKDSEKRYELKEMSDITSIFYETTNNEDWRMTRFSPYQSILHICRICTNLASAVIHILLSVCSETLCTAHTWPSMRKTSSCDGNFHRSAKYSLATDAALEKPKLHRQTNNKYHYFCHFWWGYCSHCCMFVSSIIQKVSGVFSIHLGNRQITNQRRVDQIWQRSRTYSRYCICR